MMIALNIIMAICLVSGGFCAGMFVNTAIEHHEERVAAKKAKKQAEEERLTKIENALTKILDKDEKK